MFFLLAVCSHCIKSELTFRDLERQVISIPDDTAYKSMRETEKVLNKKVVNCKIKEYPILNTAIINNAQINHSKNIKLFSRQWTNKTHSLELNIGLWLLLSSGCQ